MKENNFQNLEFDQVIEHEGKLYLSMELTVSKTISPKEIWRRCVDKEVLMEAFAIRLERCMERLQWAIVNNRIVKIEGADTSHIYYDSSREIRSEAFSVEVSSYSIIAAQAMKEAIAKLKSQAKHYIDGMWVKEYLTSLQIQQLIKAFEELLIAEDPAILDRIHGLSKYEMLDYLNWLHEAYVVSMEPNHMK